MERRKSDLDGAVATLPESWYRMNFSFATKRAGLAQTLGCAVLLAGVGTAARAQRPEARISGEIDNGARVTLQGSRPMRARGTTDAGRLGGGTRIESASIVLSRSAAQQSALEALIAAQQNPASALYHRWLGPDEFAAQYGAADADLKKVQGWLQSQGLTVDQVSRTRSVIRFSGTVAQIEAAFATEMHYVVDAAGERHFAPVGDLRVPAVFSGVVLSVRGVSDFRMKPRVKHVAVDSLKPNFTSSQTGSHFLTPADVATIYDVNAAYSAGYTGVGQSIAVIGQSAIVTSDITNFQTAAGTPVRVPTLMLVPGTGASTVYTDDESESDLDLEYSGAIAKNATIYFVYSGSNNNADTRTALAYAVTNNVASIISYSYGECEYDEGGNYASDNMVLQQAAAQGQSVIVASGDSGSTDCYDSTGDLSTVRQTLYTNFPSSSQYVTALGGTEFSAAAVAVGNTQYWTAQGSTDAIGSARSYIPEMVWNDDATANGLSAGGSGISVYTPRPSWQAGVTGIPTGSYRLVPDISLASSPNNAGYLYCSSDTDTGITGSCSHGFRDTNNTNLTVAGGTSFATPIFAGMLALINQKTGATAQGVVGPILYSLAANASTYASAFHDITSGNNGCVAGTTYLVASNNSQGPACTTAAAGQYTATTGYDLATGLGSVDLYNLLSAWPSAGTVITTSPGTRYPVAGAADTIAISVTGQTVVPSGSVTISVDGGTATTVALTPGTSNATASYSFTSSVVGTHTVTIQYAGDKNNPAASTTLTLTVVAAGSFTVSGAATTIASGSTGTATVTVTPAGGFTGTVNLTLSSTIANTCYVLSNPTITGAAAAAVAVTIYTNAANCPAGAVALAKRAAGVAANDAGTRPGAGLRAEAELAGLLMLGLAGWRSKKLRGVVLIALLAAAGFGLAGCGSGTTTGAGLSTKAAAGSYSVTITATDALSGTKTASSTFTVTIQ